ncbi:MAG: hypothetical protein R3264_02795 [Anaerolineae bacterium]|nr:hypothetical protein [Anaerolineae bacterium]
MTTDAKLLEAWFSLMAEAMRGTREAQEAFQTLAKTPADGPALQAWFRQFMPDMAASSARTPPEQFETWLDEWHEMMGVVPRARYLALLEKNDKLEQQLAKAHKTIEGLQKILKEKAGSSPEAQKVVDNWGEMFQETLKMQTEWMKNWAEANQPGEDEPDQTDEPDD